MEHAILVHIATTKKEKLDAEESMEELEGLVNAAGAVGLVDTKAIMMEVATSIKRAGADILITYFAKELAKLL